MAYKTQLLTDMHEEIMSEKRNVRRISGPGFPDSGFPTRRTQGLG